MTEEKEVKENPPAPPADTDSVGPDEMRVSAIVSAQVLQDPDLKLAQKNVRAVQIMSAILGALGRGEIVLVSAEEAKKLEKKKPPRKRATPQRKRTPKK